jgi:hypothetical protein
MMTLLEMTTSNPAAIASTAGDTEVFRVREKHKHFSAHLKTAVFWFPSTTPAKAALSRAPPSSHPRTWLALINGVWTCEE